MVSGEDGESDVRALAQRLAEVEALLDHRQRQMDAMRRTSERLFRYNDTHRMLAETLALARTVLDADAGSVLLHDAESDTLVFRHVMGRAKEALDGYAIPADQGVSGQVFQTGTPALLNDVAEHAHFISLEELTGYATQSMIVVAIRVGDVSPIGVMTILNGRRQFDARDLEVVEVLASVAAAAIHQARLAGAQRAAALAHSMGDVAHDIKNMLTPVETGLLTLQELIDDAVNSVAGSIEDANEVDVAQVRAAMAELGTHRGWLLDGALSGARRIRERTRQIADAMKGVLTPLTLSRANLNDVVREILMALRAPAERAGVALAGQLDDALPASIFDAAQIYNALYNLVHNALGATVAGDRVTISSRSAGDQIVLSVEDTGEGMSEEVRSTLFTDATISTQPGGSGLGTRIVAGVVERHRGRIEVESQAGIGTCFTLRLPIDPGG